MEGKGEEDLLKEIQYLTNLIQSHGGQDSRNNNSGITSSSHYHWNRQLSKKPLAVQSSKNVHTLFPRRPSAKTKKRLQKLGLSYHVLEPSVPHRKKCLNKPSSIKTKIPMQQSNLVYVNPCSVGSGGTESCNARVGGVESQTSVSTKVASSPCSTAVRDVAQTASKAKMAGQTMPMESISQAQPGHYQNIKTSKKKRRKSKLSKKCLPSRTQLTWRRKSLYDDHRESSSLTAQSNSTEHTVLKSNNHSAIFAGPSSRTTATKKQPHSSANNVYKWRRRSSSGSKQSAPMSPLVSHSKFKMTRASLVRKYNYIRRSPQMKPQLRQMRFTAARQHSSQAKNRPVKFHSKSKNRVWIGSGVTAMSGGPRGATRSMRLSLMSPFSGVLAGRETKTRQGNRQWVSNRHLQLTQQSLRKAALLSSAKRASLVSLEKGSYVLDPSRRKLKKVDSTVMVSTPSVSPLTYRVTMEASVKRIRANHVVEKSRRYAWHAKNKSKNKSKQYCIFFNRFGKCNRGEKCLYIHDPDKIAVCTKYLKGVCDKTDGSCPLSHKISKEKMPVCSFFLRGICIREKCPYLHVSVGKDADICMDFVKGYCSKGEQCTKKHVLDCPEFLNGGECPRGKQCPLRHHKRIVKSAYKSQNTGVDVKQPRVFGNIQHRLSQQLTDREEHDHNQHGTYTSQELNFIPLELDSAPDFIAL